VSGDRHTGTRPDLCSISFCRIGLEISRFLTLLRSGLAFLGRELNLPPCFSLSATDSDGVLLTLEISLDRPPEPGSGLSFSLCPESSMRQTWGWAATALG